MKGRGGGEVTAKSKYFMCWLFHAPSRMESKRAHAAMVVSHM